MVSGDNERHILWLDMIGSRPPPRFDNLREITQKKYNMFESKGVNLSRTNRWLWGTGRVAEERREGTK